MCLEWENNIPYQRHNISCQDLKEIPYTIKLNSCTTLYFKNSWEVNRSVYWRKMFDSSWEQIQGGIVQPSPSPLFAKELTLYHNSSVCFIRVRRRPRSNDDSPRFKTCSSSPKADEGPVGSWPPRVEKNADVIYCQSTPNISGLWFSIY